MLSSNVTGSQLLVRRTMATRDCYSRKFLFGDLLPAARKCTGSEFAKFHHNIVNDFIDNFNFSSISVSIQRFNKNFIFEDFEFYRNYNICYKDKFIYREKSKFDKLKRFNIQNAGVAILNSDIMPLENWLDTELYYYLKKPLGLHQSATIMYNIPFANAKKFKIVYFSNMTDLFSPEITCDEIEYFTLPFFLGWLRRASIIDTETLINWLELLEGMTPKRLALLREIANTGRYQNAAVAARLNVSDRVVRNYIAEAYSAITHLLPDPDVAQANTSPCVDLVRCYDFLKLVGSGGASTNRESAAIQ